MTTNASKAQIDAANEAKAAKEANEKRVVAGLPQVATRVPKKILSVMDILKKNMTKDAPAPTTGKQETPIAKQSHIEKMCPELVKGLMKPDGTPHPGALVDTDPDGKFGEAGAIYIVRFVTVNKPMAKWILENKGAANRTPTKAKLTDYTAHMDVGIGGGDPKGWQFVFNTAIFTVDNAGNVIGTDLEQHNGGHTCRSLLAAADPNATIKMLFCFGVPKRCRDILDKNQQRTAKDIASTRTELREMFEPGSMIGGLVKVTPALSTSCIGFVTQTTAIVNNIRHGLQAKTGGNQGVDADVLDLYTMLVATSVQGIVALDHVCGCSGKNNKGVAVQKTSGGLKKRYAVNHLAAVQSLIAGYKASDGTLKYCDEIGNQVLDAYSLLANENETDATEPMVSLRMQVDTWDRMDAHKGSAGMNVRFIALQLAVLKQLAGEKIHATNWLAGLNAQSGKANMLMGLGTVNPDTGAVLHYADDQETMVDDEGNVCENPIPVGIDDFVNPSDLALAQAGQEAAKEGDASLEELIDDVDGPSSDTPEEEEEAIDE